MREGIFTKKLQKRDVDVQAILPSVTVIALLVAVIVVGAVIIVIRTCRHRQECNRGADIERGTTPLFGQARVPPVPRLLRVPDRRYRKKGSGPEPEGRQWRDWWPDEPFDAKVSEKPNPFEEAKGHSIEKGTGIQAQRSAPLAKPFPDRLELQETGEGSLRKLQYLTGSKIVPSSRNLPKASDSLAAMLASVVPSKKPTTDAMYISQSESSSNGSVFAEPTNASASKPANTTLAYTTIAELRRAAQGTPIFGRRVSSTISGYRTRQISTQDSRPRHHEYYTYSPKIYSREQYPQSTRSKTGSLAGPLKFDKGRSIVSIGDTKANRKSWSGRSVLELDPSDQEMTTKKLVIPDRKPVPHPVQEGTQHNTDPSKPGESLPGGMIHLPLAHNPGQDRQFGLNPISWQLGFGRLRPVSGISLTSDLSSISSYGIAQPSPVFSGLSPMPLRSWPVSPALPRRDAGGPSTSAVHKGHYQRYSMGSKSVSETILTENSTRTNLTEEEIRTEMEKIRERARRASIDRKAKRIEMEQLAAGEEDAQGVKRAEEGKS